VQQRLITAGCSFSNYIWSTWSDYAGKHFNQHIKLGVGGCDNAHISREIIKTAKKNDVVIVMWTGFDRWSNLTQFKDPTIWNHNGCIVSNKEYYVNHYATIERFTTTLDYIQLLDLHSKVNDYECFHFSAFPFFLAEFEFYVDHAYMIDMFNNCDINNNYIETISLLEYQEKHKQQFITSHHYCKKDNHPTPITHWEYFEKVIAPIIGISVDNTVQDSVQYEQDKIMNGDVNA